MGEVVSFKKLDYSNEAEEITSRTVKLAFWPIKITVSVTVVSFIIYLLLGYGSLRSFINSGFFSYLLLALFVSSIWLITDIRFGLRCPNCKNTFFRFTRKLQMKPRSCPHCKVIFVKKTHPLEDDYDFSREFYLLKVEVERRADLALFYLFIGTIVFLYLIYPISASLIGSSLTVFIVFPVLLVLTVIYLIRQLETRCPSCQEFIKWTELKPTELSKYCPHCDAKLVK